MQDPSNRAALPLIVLAEDDAALCGMMASALIADGYEVDSYARGDSLVAALSRTRTPALIVADLCLPGANGLAVLRALRSFRDSVPIVLITSFASEETLNDAFRMGASVVLSKPFAVDDLRHLVACFLTPARAAARR